MVHDMTEMCCLHHFSTGAGRGAVVQMQPQKVSKETWGSPEKNGTTLCSQSKNGFLALILHDRHKCLPAGGPLCARCATCSCPSLYP